MNVEDIAIQRRVIFGMTEDQISKVDVSLGSAKTLVKRGGITITIQ